MASPRVADRGDGLQIWRVAANMLNKWVVPQPPRLTPPPPRKTQYLLRIITHSLGTERITWHHLSTGKWIWDLVHGMLGAFIGQVHWKR
jgi:hypothetical protein